MSLGDRMKGNYEQRDRHYLTRRIPVIVRVDGRAFHSFTRGCDRPFDSDIIVTMVEAAMAVCQDAQGCKAAYIQSDEASFLLTDYDKLTTEAWFGYNQSKVESISASLMTAWFNRFWPHDRGKPAMFDARAFNIPREEVSNYFLWRMKDWERNSVSMYCQAHFSHKQLHGKGRSEQHDLLHSIGLNWATDLTPQLRNGTLLLPNADGKFQQHHDVLPVWSDVDAIIAPLLEEQPKETAEAGQLQTVMAGTIQPDIIQANTIDDEDGELSKMTDEFLDDVRKTFGNVESTAAEQQLTADEIFVEIRAICDRTGCQTSDMVKALVEIEDLLGIDRLVERRRI